MDFKQYQNRPLATATDDELESELDSRRGGDNPFPIHLFPTRLKPFIQALISEIDCDPSYVGGSMLAVFSTAIGSYYTVSPTDTWNMGLTLWTANVGISSGGKSMTETYVLKPLRKIQKEMDYENATADKADENMPDVTDRVRKKEIIIQNSTFEAMVKETMVDNPKGMIKLEDELTSWLDGMRQYSSTDIERKFWLSAWNMRPYKMRRSGNKYIYVEKPCCSVLGGVQPRYLSKFFSEDLLGEGFTVRMLFNVPDGGNKIANANLLYKFDKHILESYSEVIENLHSSLSVGLDQEPEKIKVPLSALSEYIKWEKEKREVINEIPDHAFIPKDIIAMCFGKIKEYAFKFSAIMAIVEAACDGQGYCNVTSIADKHMEAGLLLADYYYESFQRSYMMSSSKLFVPIDIMDLARLWKTGTSYRKMAEMLGMKQTTMFNKIKKAMREYPHVFGASGRS